MIERLVASVPSLRPVLEAHVADNDVMLPHVFFGDVTRFVMDAIGRDTQRRVDALRVIAFLEAELADAQVDVDNIISVSFLENVNWNTSAGAVIRAALGPNLTAEQARRETGR